MVRDGHWAVPERQLNLRPDTTRSMAHVSCGATIFFSLNKPEFLFKFISLFIYLFYLFYLFIYFWYLVELKTPRKLVVRIH